MDSEVAGASRAPRWTSGDGDALGQALTFVLVPALFGLLGRWIDGVAGTRPVFLVGMVVVGVVSVFVTVYYRYQARMAELDAGKPWDRSAS